MREICTSGSDWGCQRKGKLPRLASTNHNINHEKLIKLVEMRCKVIHTPGHTNGSVTVLLSSGEAIVGDLAINYLPFGLGPIYPPFATDTKELINSWKIVIDSITQIIYPGHGSPFSKSLLLKKLISVAEKHIV